MGGVAPLQLIFIKCESSQSKHSHAENIKGPISTAMRGENCKLHLCNPMWKILGELHVSGVAVITSCKINGDGSGMPNL